MTSPSSAWAALRRRLAAPVRATNDIAGDVVTFFRILQRHYPAFMDELRYRFTSRGEFERLLAIDPAPARTSSIERAVRFLSLQRTAFGGKVAGHLRRAASSGRFDVFKLGEILSALADRLSSDVIEHLPWQAFIRRYDRPDTVLEEKADPEQDFFGEPRLVRAIGRVPEEMIESLAA